MDCSIYKREQTPDVLSEMWANDYYWYLRSEAFKKQFLSKIGGIVNELCRPEEWVIDVGCLAGDLADFVGCRYLGIDACREAIEEARRNNPPPTKTPFFWELQMHEAANWNQKLYPPYNARVIVFGSVLYCLVLREKHVDFLREFLSAFGCEHFIVYDLQRFDTSHIQVEYDMIQKIEGEANLPELERVKRRRKIEVYRCRKS